MIRPLTALTLAGLVALNCPLFSQPATGPTASSAGSSVVSIPEANSAGPEFLGHVLGESFESFAASAVNQPEYRMTTCRQSTTWGGIHTIPAVIVTGLFDSVNEGQLEQGILVPKYSVQDGDYSIDCASDLHLDKNGNATGEINNGFLGQAAFRDGGLEALVLVLPQKWDDVMANATQQLGSPTKQAQEGSLHLAGWMTNSYVVALSERVTNDLKRSVVIYFATRYRAYQDGVCKTCNLNATESQPAGMALASMVPIADVAVTPTKGGSTSVAPVADVSASLAKVASTSSVPIPVVPVTPTKTGSASVVPVADVAAIPVKVPSASAVPVPVFGATPTNVASASVVPVADVAAIPAKVPSASAVPVPVVGATPTNVASASVVPVAVVAATPASVASASVVPAAVAAAVPAQKSSVVQITSEPDGADIEVDGNFVGSTPSQVELPPGDYSLRVTKNGYVPWEKKLHTIGGNVTINAEMGSQPMVYHVK
ncbi:MAG: PEGA domain-containing protein [Alloacidobacterium sp.]